MSSAEMSYLKMLQYLYIKHQSGGQMVPEAEGQGLARRWTLGCATAPVSLQLSNISAQGKAQAKRRMGRGALPWPALLLCAPLAADAPENVDLTLGECRGRWLKEMSQNLPGLLLGMLQNARGEGRAWFATLHSEFVPLGPRVADGLWEGGVMEAGWRGETHPGMGCSLP